MFVLIRYALFRLRVPYAWKNRFILKFTSPTPAIQTELRELCRLEKCCLKNTLSTFLKLEFWSFDLVHHGHFFNVFHSTWKPEKTFFVSNISLTNTTLKLKIRLRVLVSSTWDWTSFSDVNEDPQPKSSMLKINTLHDCI